MLQHCQSIVRIRKASMLLFTYLLWLNRGVKTWKSSTHICVSDLELYISNDLHFITYVGHLSV